MYYDVFNTNKQYNFNIQKIKRIVKLRLLKLSIGAMGFQMGIKWEYNIAQIVIRPVV